MLHVHGIDLLVEKTLGSVAEEQHVEFLRPYDGMLDFIGSTAWEMNNRSTSESCRWRISRPPRHPEDGNYNIPSDGG